MTQVQSLLQHLRSAEIYVVRVERFLTLVTLVGVLICIGLGIALRVTGISAAWTNEAAQILLVWMMFIGANLGFYHGEHVGMSALVDRLGRKARLLGLYVVQVGLIVFCAYCAMTGAWFVSFQQMMGGSTIALPVDIPKYVIAAILPVSFVFGLLHVVLQLFDREEKLDAPEVLSAEGTVFPGQVLANGDGR